MRLALVMLLCSSVLALAAPKAGLRVMSSEKRIAFQLRNALTAQLQGRVDIVKDPKQADSTLWVMVERTARNAKNPGGYSIAIAHTNQASSRRLAALIEELGRHRRADQHALGEARKLAAQINNDTPPLRYLNVANVADMDPGTVANVARALARDFLGHRVK